MSDPERTHLLLSLHGHEDNLKALQYDIEFFQQMKNRATLDGNWAQVDKNNELISNILELVNVTRDSITALRNELGYEDNKASERPCTLTW